MATNSTLDEIEVLVTNALAEGDSSRKSILAHYRLKPIFDNPNSYPDDRDRVESLMDRVLSDLFNFTTDGRGHIRMENE